MEMNMARLPGGMEHLAQAQDLLKKAKTVEELRTAQAVALPLLFNLSIEQTAQIIGRSVGATSGPPHSECIDNKRHELRFAPAANLLFTIRLCPSPT